METLNYKVLAETGYNGYVLKDAPVKVMQFGEGNFLRAFVDYFIDIANEKAGFNGKVKLVQPIANFPQMADWINEQEGLYTLYLRGSEKGQKVDAKRAPNAFSPKQRKKLASPNTPPKIAPAAGPKVTAPTATGTTISVISIPAVLMYPSGVKAMIRMMATKSAISTRNFVENFFLVIVPSSFLVFM